MNTQTKLPIPSWVPYAVGALLVVQFAGLGVWQISRGLEKRADRQAYDARGGYARFEPGMDVRPYQALAAAGTFLDERQFLLDNIIINSRYGYYVVTPLEFSADEPLLLVNRGWIEKPGPAADIDKLSEQLALNGSLVIVSGHVGALPKAGMRMGEAFEGSRGWPRVAVYPSADEISAELGREVEPFVLLMDPEDEQGFLRYWVPEEMGPGKHFGYALQWFAMGIVLAGLLVWNYRKRGPGDA